MIVDTTTMYVKRKGGIFEASRWGVLWNCLSGFPCVRIIVVTYTDDSSGPLGRITSFSLASYGRRSGEHL